ncbi:MAG: UDP-N-acetylmuramate--L-alanine ligase [Elusimicrobia bacterium GWA2_69_24]|nr:MAG: UDP-N-acetylmuramate--L-alanine ligase [Elusimicrobia bacterium GWA2_69_24]HBL15509.1 UDP-N-acetylmuramate--L-alanine ligase [Elusimicrobiota bacterium]
MMDFVRRVHFVGIGGVGMSGIAQILLNLGYTVSGSDLKETELTRSLADAGARVRIGHRAGNIRGADVVVFSTAVDLANPELRAARAAGIPVARRVELLAEIARLKKTITVSGTHGKTTTTAMIALALEKAGVDPTVIVGGQVALSRGGQGSTAKLGLGEYLVAEADESDGSFLKLFPLVAVVTNVDDDHLDHYGTFAALQEAFLEHLRHLPFYGTAVLCADDPVVRSLLPKVDRPVVTYALADSRVRADWIGRLLPTAPGRGECRMEVRYRGKKLGLLALRVPGRHNALNALAAVAVGRVLGLDRARLFAGLSEFRGVGRRLELLGEAGGIRVIDDYGHHPTEVRATLAALRTVFPRGGKRGARGPRGRRVVVLFQPHRYTRTKSLFRAFGAAFAAADQVYIMDIYPAGEKPIRGVSSRLILDAMARQGRRAQAFTRTVDLMRDLREGDVLLTLGAGDVWKSGMDVLRRLQAHTYAAV